jgi:hypothetical protein
MIPPEDYDELILRHLDGDTSAEETERVNECLSNDAEFQRRFCALVLQIAQTRRLLGAKVVAPPGMESTLPREDSLLGLAEPADSTVCEPLRRTKQLSWPRSILLATAVTASIIAVGVWMWMRQSAHAFSVEVVELHGKVEVQRGGSREPVTPALVARPSERVLTGPTGYARLRYADGTVVDLNGDTEVALVALDRSKAIELVRGTCYLEVAKQPEFAPFVINPGRADQVVVVGTKLQLHRSATGDTRVGVVAGKVKVGSKKTIILESQSETVVRGSQDPSPASPLTEGTVWYGLGRGLAAMYYQNLDFTGKSSKRIDPVVDFMWGLSAPIAGIDGESFSARWTGQIDPSRSDTYIFALRVDDSARLWIDGELVIDAWNVPPRSKHTSEPLSLVAGRRYDIRLDYRDVGHHAEVHLLWSTPTMRETPVPQFVLYPTRQ